MDMVFGPVDQHGLAPKVGDDAAYVGVKVRLDFGFDEWLTLLGAEQSVS
jgi:hypothetical protein